VNLARAIDLGRRDAPETRPALAERVAPVALLSLAVVFWLVSLPRIDTNAIGSLGLLSALPVTMYVGFALVAVSMVISIHRNESSPKLAAHVITFVLMLHATPAIKYQTLRYSWAWRHLGLVDELTHSHSVAPAQGQLGVYRSWPGFFSTASSWLSAVGGERLWTGVVQWAPPFFELLAALAVYTVLQSLTEDRRVVWLGVWFYVIANWIGQDYFSPQAFAFFLYLVVIALALRVQARRPVMPRALHNRFALARAPDSPIPIRTINPEQRRATTVLAILCSAAIITSHPLTPIVLLAALALLAVTRVLPWRGLPLYVGALEVLWLLTGARDYVTSNSSSILNGVGEFSSNVNQTLVRSAHAASAQRLVSFMGRAEVVLIVLLAIAGLLRRLRHGRWDLPAALLTIAPVAIVFGSAYGGEATFRVYLFALPFLAFFAAALCYPTQRMHRFAAPVALGASAILIVATLFAYYGKEQWAHFSTGEARAASYLYSVAPPHSLVVEGVDDYPTRFRDVGQITYVTLVAEPTASSDRVIADPVGVLYGWLTDPRYRDGYVIITRSQKDEVDALGELPKGALAAIESQLIASPYFHVLYHDNDATVVTAARGAPGTP
jgi:hypothetical protein